MIKNKPTLYPKNQIWKRKTDGFRLFKPSKDRTLVLVPKKHRTALITRQHHDLCHAGYAKVYSALSKHWHWPTMKKDVRQAINNYARVSY